MWRRARVLVLESQSEARWSVRHQMDGWPLYARLSARPEISPESNSVQTLQKSFR